jgi:broad specificity phosphatase PhoE
MNIVEVRRHAQRGEDGHIGAEGRATCEKARRSMEWPFDRYVASPKPRAVETLEALGAEGHETDERFGTLPHERLKPYEAEVRKLMEERDLTLLAAYCEHDETVGILSEKGLDVLAALRDLAARLPEGGKALVVSHSGTIEPAACMALGLDYGDVFGADLDFCEGVRFYLEGDDILRVDVVRLAP